MEYTQSNATIKKNLTNKYYVNAIISLSKEERKYIHTYLAEAKFMYKKFFFKREGTTLPEIAKSFREAQNRCEEYIQKHLLVSCYYTLSEDYNQPYIYLEGYRELTDAILIKVLKENIAHIEVDAERERKRKQQIKADRLSNLKRTLRSKTAAKEHIKEVKKAFKI